MADVESLEILKWAIENGCSWTKKICSRAASKGHFDILKWVRENGCPWDEKVCYNAAYKGHFDILKWAVENGCPWDDEAYFWIKHDLTMIEWFNSHRI